MMATMAKGIDDSLLKLFAEHKTALQEKFQVESLAVFGSVSRGSASPESDIDILVRYRETPGLFAFLDLKRYLEEIIGRPVDLVTEGALKKQLKEHILHEAINIA